MNKYIYVAREWGRIRTYMSLEIKKSEDLQKTEDLQKLHGNAKVEDLNSYHSYPELLNDPPQFVCNYSENNCYMSV